MYSFIYNLAASGSWETHYGIEEVAKWIRILFSSLQYFTGKRENFISYQESSHSQ